MLNQLRSGKQSRLEVILQMPLSDVYFFWQVCET